jgi:hypothetical protein
MGQTSSLLKGHLDAICLSYNELKDLDVLSRKKELERYNEIDLSWNKLENVFVMDFLSILQRNNFKCLNLIGNLSTFGQRSQLKRLDAKEAKKLLWMNGIQLDYPSDFREYYSSSISDKDFQEIVDNHKAFFLKRDGLVVKMLAEGDVQQHYPAQVKQVQEGSAETCKIFGLFLHKRGRLDLTIKWLNFAIERGAYEMIFMRNECIQTLKPTQLIQQYLVVVHPETDLTTAVWSNLSIDIIRKEETQWSFTVMTSSDNARVLKDQSGVIYVEKVSMLAVAKLNENKTL